MDYVTDLLSAERLRSAGYFDPVAVGKLLDKCRAGRVIGFSDNMAFVGGLSTMLVDELFNRGEKTWQHLSQRAADAAPIS